MDNKIYTLTRKKLTDGIWVADHKVSTCNHVKDWRYKDKRYFFCPNCGLTVRDE